MRIATTVAILILLAAGGVVNYMLLSEAYGSGAPYFSQTTNMDKWSSPWPFLAPFNVVVLLALAGMIWWGWMRKASSRPR